MGGRVGVSTLDTRIVAFEVHFDSRRSAAGSLRYGRQASISPFSLLRAEFDAWVLGFLTDI